MLTSRQRILNALNFKPVDRTPRDLGGMLSTGISAFAYPRLVAALGLPPRLPRVHDTGQMLALPDLDVLDALGCDAVTILNEVTNAYSQPELWHPYDFGGRLPALVLNPDHFSSLSDGSLFQLPNSQMPASAYTFDEVHAGNPLILDGDLPHPDLKQFRQQLMDSRLTDEQVKRKTVLYRRAREATDRAVFLSESSLMPPMSIHGWGGIAVFPVLCITEPDFVVELHEIAVEYALDNIRRLAPEIAPYVDVIMTNADDWGTQGNLIASPKVFRSLFMPYRKRVNEELHRQAPEVKAFLHSCGAIYDIIDSIIESKQDILNPVQWSAGKHSYQQWKDKARKRIALWGGGVNSQSTLPLGNVKDVEEEVREVVTYLAQDSGFVFCNIHNILSEIAPEKVIAMYRAAGEVTL